MKTYDVPENRLILVVKKKDGDFTVLMKEKEAEKLSEKYIEFTPSRWASFRQHFEEIDKNVVEMCNGVEDIKFQHHLGGGYYVSVTSGFKCVDFRRWYKPYGRQEIKPTRNGVALRLCEWAGMRQLIDGVNNQHPTLAIALPCYMSDDHNNQISALECYECNPFFR